jgi:prolyl-tRNA editing enzyme YbaK/EbsC (Cys-tRNA(Pro) deacylase)
MFWSQLKKDFGTVWLDAALDSSALSKEDIWKEGGRQGSDMRINPIETAVEN